MGDYDDWMYDEIRYSLESREGNRTNGLVAVYTPEVADLLINIQPSGSVSVNNVDAMPHLIDGFAACIVAFSISIVFIPCLLPCAAWPMRESWFRPVAQIATAPLSAQPVWRF